ERLPQTLIHLLDGSGAAAGFEAAEDLRRLRASKGLPRAQQDPAWGAFDEKFRARRPAAGFPDRLRQHDLTLRRELCRFHRKMVRRGKTTVNRGSAVPSRRPRGSASAVTGASWSPAWASPGTSRARSPQLSRAPERRLSSCTPPRPAMATSA